MRHGETGSVLVDAALENALLIPQKCTFEILDKRYVFVVDKDDIVRSRQIVVGAEMPHLYAVQAGLKETDRILLEGLRKVRDSDKITVEFVGPQEVMSHLELHAE